MSKVPIKKQANGLKRFEFFMSVLKKLLKKSLANPNPAMWLYHQDARKSLFMLEALAKLYAGIHDKKKFNSLRQKFKAAEDLLGQIDYYDVLLQNFKNNINIPPEVITELRDQRTKYVNRLNRQLKKEWSKEQVNKIRKLLSNITWLDEPNEIRKIRSYFGKQENKIIRFKNSKGYHFNNLEKDVHELRRKIRWLSIYAIALNGSVQLVKREETPDYLRKYLTAEVIESPYNKLPDAKDYRCFLLLDRDYFFALSWLISELGKLKDNGYQVIEIRKVLKNKKGMSDDEASKKAYQVLGPQQRPLAELLKNAADISNSFFNEVPLIELVAGTAIVEE